MRRREFLALLGGLAVPFDALAQNATMPLIGFISSRSLEDSKPHLAGFLRGLEAFGYVDGKTAKIEYRWANGRYDQLPKLAAELVQLGPAVIAAAGGAPSARAAKSATSSIPIVFVTSDPVADGLVTSLNRPADNISGVDVMSGELTGKRLELLVQLVRPGGTIGFLVNPQGMGSDIRIKEVQSAAQKTGHGLQVFVANTDAELVDLVAKSKQSSIAGFVVHNDPFFDSRREQLTRLMAELSIPAIYHIREFPAGNGLMSYGASLVDAYYQMGVQLGRVLKGAPIASLPVVRPTKFELVINLSAARALGLSVPSTLIAQADEVIE